MIPAMPFRLRTESYVFLGRRHFRDRNAIKFAFPRAGHTFSLSKGEEIDAILLAYAAFLSDGVALH